MKHDTTPATKGDLSEFEEKITRQMATDKEEVKRHFDVVAESLFHDLAGAHHDEIELLKHRKDDHERRIRHLERAAGLFAA